MGGERRRIKKKASPATNHTTIANTRFTNIKRI